jgi:hypothetical protein
MKPSRVLVQSFFAQNSPVCVGNYSRNTGEKHVNREGEDEKDKKV